MKKPLAFTVHDVARMAGVSAMTVSRALNHPERVAPATLLKVREVVSQTGFVPNGMAGGLRSSRARLVAAVLPTLTGPVFQETVRSLNQALDERGYQLMIGQSGYGTSREDALLDAIIRRRPDGIVLTGIMHSTEGRRQLLAAGIPVVETWDLTPTPIDMLVGFSHERIGETVCRFLHQRGYRHPLLLGANDDRARLRMQGFRRAAQALGLDAEVPAVLVPAPTTLGSGRSGLGEALATHPATDAVFCSSDMLALGVLIEAQARGLSVPQQLAVVGLGDLEFAASLQPALTTVRIDGTRIGRTAAQFIDDRAEGRTIDQPIVDIASRSFRARVHEPWRPAHIHLPHLPDDFKQLAHSPFSGDHGLGPTRYGRAIAGPVGAPFHGFHGRSRVGCAKALGRACRYALPVRSRTAQAAVSHSLQQQGFLRGGKRLLHGVGRSATGQTGSWTLLCKERAETWWRCACLPRSRMP